MYKYMLNSVVKISMMSVKYFESTPLYLGGPFFRGHAVQNTKGKLVQVE